MAYSSNTSQPNPFNPYHRYPPMFGNPFQSQPQSSIPPQQFHGPSPSLRPPIPRPTQDIPQSSQSQPQRTSTPPTPPGIPYIGARISLISNMNIRYEGTLYTIDPKEATVALQSVRCFGTEGRVPPSEEVAPSPHSYQFIIFRGKDIKDLHVCEPNVNRFPSQPPPPQDPAIVATGNVSPFTAPLGLGSFNKPDPKQSEIEQKLLEERLRLSNLSNLSIDPLTDPFKDKNLSFLSTNNFLSNLMQSASTALTNSSSSSSQSSSFDSTSIPKSKTPPPKTGRTEQNKGSTPSQQQQPQQSQPQQPTGSQQVPSPSSKKQSSNNNQSQQRESNYDTNRSNQYKSKNLSPRGSKQAPRGSQQQNQGNRKPKSGRQDRRRVEEPAGGNYNGPGTGSYLERRSGSTNTSQGIPQEEFDFQSSNARFDKAGFNAQLKGAQKSKEEEDDKKDGNQNESDNDPMKKLKNEKQPTSPSNLSPSAQPFVPASETKKDKEQDVKVEGAPATNDSGTPEAPKYEKRNFYDDISTDRDMSQRRDMMKKDTETFGTMANNYGHYNRQRPRYYSSGGGRGGRGGRGGWRGNSGPGRSSLTAHG